MTSPAAPSPPLSPVSSALTVRSILTGMVLGGALSLCNIYSGLKVGWGFSMSITAALLAFGFWQMARAVSRTSPFSIQENTLNLTAASAGASISSAGLVAPIPALTMLTGQVLTLTELIVWTFSVCLVGIVVAIGLRRQMIEVDALPFPSGLAAGETLREIYAEGREALGRVRMLLAGVFGATALKLVEYFATVPRWPLPGQWRVRAGGALEQAGHGSLSVGNLGFALEPTALMYAVGSLIGLRTGLSLLGGSLLAWGILAPWALEMGWAKSGPAGDAARSWYGPVLSWLLWPGVAMMVTAALTSFAFSWRAILRALRPAPRAASAAAPAPVAGEPSATAAAGFDLGRHDLPRRWFLLSLAGALVISVTLQAAFFGIAVWVATLGVLLTFCLALVAARVSGETNITPVGAMGKVTQLIFAVLTPGQPAPNLMAANVTGGAASQCAELMHDFKTGHMVGARPDFQILAQTAGALAGAICGSAAYLVLVPDPARQLLTDEWPAPAAAAWKAVAEIFMRGLGALPPGTLAGMIWAGLAGIVLAILEKTLPKRTAVWVPSPASLGLAFVIPAYNSLSLCLGAVAATLLQRRFPTWSGRFLIVLASGIIAGESLTGVGLALVQMIFPAG